MEDFEKAIKDFTSKVVDKNGFEYYVLKERPKVNTYNLDKGSEVKKGTTRTVKVIAPDGKVFRSLREAAILYGKTDMTIKKWAMIGKNGWKFYED